MVKITSLYHVFRGQFNFHLNLLIPLILAAIYLNTASAAEINFVVPSNATASLTLEYRQIVDDFNKAHPDHQINLTPRTSYNQVLDLALKKEVKGVFAAEIAEMYTLQEAEAIVPIGIYKTDTKNLEKYLNGFVPAFLKNSYNSDGKLMALPLFRSTPIIYYNLDMLEKAGIETSTLPRTWSELTKVLIRLRDFYGRPAVALPGIWREWVFESFVQQNGGQLSGSKSEISLNNSYNIDALETWAKWRRQDLVYLPDSWKDGISSYLRRLIPITYYSTAGMAAVRKHSTFRWTVDVMPGNPKPGAVVGGANLFLSSGMSEEQKLLSEELLMHLLSPENQAKISAASGYFPVVKASFDLPVLSNLYDKEPAYMKARKQLQYAHARMMTLNHKSIRVLFQQAIEETLSGQFSARQALTNAQEKATKLITNQ